MIKSTFSFAPMPCIRPRNAETASTVNTQRNLANRLVTAAFATEIVFTACYFFPVVGPRFSSHRRHELWNRAHQR